MGFSELALPLPAGGRALVAAGDWVRAGTALARGGAAAADILAPLSGRVAGVARRVLAADGAAAQCVVLRELRQEAPARVEAADALGVLRAAGIVGLGGGAFAAAGKWRRNARVFIANGLETDPEARHDAARIAACGAALPDAVATAAAAFGARPYLALPPEAARRVPHAMTRAVAGDYALGAERLLIAHLCGPAAPPLASAAVAADYGAVCFNIGTVLAMAAALTRGEPLLGRWLTLIDAAGESRVLQVPFGARVGDVRRLVAEEAGGAAHELAGAGVAASGESEANGGARAAAAEDNTGGISAGGAPQAMCGAWVGGADERRFAADDEIVTAAVAIMRLAPPPPRRELPCIVCGACEDVCPVGLSPLRLHKLALDGQVQAMVDNNLMHCLTCRRCDAVCPSNIALTAQFAKSKKHHKLQAAEAALTARRKSRFDAHEARKAKPPARIAAAALRRQIEKAIRG